MKGIRTYKGKTLTSYNYTLYLERDPKTGKQKQKWYGGFSSAEEAAAHRALMKSTLDQQKALAGIQAFIPGVQGLAVQGLPGMPAQGEPMILKDFFIEWDRDYLQHHVEVTTAENHQNDIRIYINPYLGDHYLHELQPLIIQQWITGLLEHGRQDGKGLAPVTVDHAFRTLKMALEYAVDMKMGRIKENPAEGVTPPRIGFVRQDGIPLEAVQKICDKARGTRWHTPIVLAANTGMRRSEVMGLIWKSVDFEAKTLTVESALVQTNRAVHEKGPKSRAGNRTVTLDHLTLDELLKHQERERGKFRALGIRWSRKKPVFTNDQGERYHPESFSKAAKRTMERAGYPDLHLNDLRHAHVSNLLSAGVPVLVVAERVGHADATMTLRVYGHVIPADRERFANLDESLVKPGG